MFILDVTKTVQITVVFLFINSFVRNIHIGNSNSSQITHYQKVTSELLHTCLEKAWQNGDTMIDVFKHYKTPKQKLGVTGKTMLVLQATKMTSFLMKWV